MHNLNYKVRNCLKIANHHLTTQGCHKTSICLKKKSAISTRKNKANYNKTGLCLYILGYHGSEVKVAQSCPTLCDPMDCSLLGSAVPGILQVRILAWVAVPFSGEFSQTTDHVNERVTGRKARGLQTEEIGCKCQTFLISLKRQEETN